MPDEYRAQSFLDGLIPDLKIGDSMNQQIYTNFSNLHYYRLEPHDGTRYEFFFFDPTMRAGKSETLETSMKMEPPEDLLLRTVKVLSYHDREKSTVIPITGIFNGEGHIMLGIVMSSGQGVHSIDRSTLDAIRNAWENKDEAEIAKRIGYTVGYWGGHTAQAVYAPTITVCILALAILINDPYALDEAVRIASRGMEIHWQAFEAEEA